MDKKNTKEKKKRDDEIYYKEFCSEQKEKAFPLNGKRVTGYL